MRNIVSGEMVILHARTKNITNLILTEGTECITVKQQKNTIFRWTTFPSFHFSGWKIGLYCDSQALLNTKEGIT